MQDIICLVQLPKNVRNSLAKVHYLIIIFIDKFLHNGLHPMIAFKLQIKGYEES